MSRVLAKIEAALASGWVGPVCVGGLLVRLDTDFVTAALVAIIYVNLPIHISKDAP